MNSCESSALWGNAAAVTEGALAKLIAHAKFEEDHEVKEECVVQIIEIFLEPISGRWDDVLEEMILMRVHDNVTWTLACLPSGLKGGLAPEKRPDAMREGTLICLKKVQLRNYIADKMCLMLKSFAVAGCANTGQPDIGALDRLRQHTQKPPPAPLIPRSLTLPKSVLDRYTDSEFDKFLPPSLNVVQSRLAQHPGAAMRFGGTDQDPTDKIHMDPPHEPSLRDGNRGDYGDLNYWRHLPNVSRHGYGAHEVVRDYPRPVNDPNGHFPAGQHPGNFGYGLNAMDQGQGGWDVGHGYVEAEMMAYPCNVWLPSTIYPNNQGQPAPPKPPRFHEKRHHSRRKDKHGHRENNFAAPPPPAREVNHIANPAGMHEWHGTGAGAGTGQQTEPYTYRDYMADVYVSYFERRAKEAAARAGGSWPPPGGHGFTGEGHRTGRDVINANNRGFQHYDQAGNHSMPHHRFAERPPEHRIGKKGGRSVRPWHARNKGRAAAQQGAPSGSASRQEASTSAGAFNVQGKENLIPNPTSRGLAKSIQHSTFPKSSDGQTSRTENQAMHPASSFQSSNQQSAGNSNSFNADGQPGGAGEQGLTVSYNPPARVGSGPLLKVISEGEIQFGTFCEDEASLAELKRTLEARKERAELVTEGVENNGDESVEASGSENVKGDGAQGGGTRRWIDVVKMGANANIGDE